MEGKNFRNFGEPSAADLKRFRDRRRRPEADEADRARERERHQRRRVEAGEEDRARERERSQRQRIEADEEGLAREDCFKIFRFSMNQGGI